jgi:hypothetical protein
MALHVFLILCGLSISFLVYVLVQLWREGHQGGTGAEPAMYRRPWNPDLVVLTHPISLNARGGISVIPLQLEAPIPEDSAKRSREKAQVLQMPGQKCPSDTRNGARNSKINAG